MEELELDENDVLRLEKFDGRGDSQSCGVIDSVDLFIRAVELPAKRLARDCLS
jgi:hypothetical protein